MKVGTKSEQLICFWKGTRHKGDQVAVPMSLQLKCPLTRRRGDEGGGEKKKWHTSRLLHQQINVSVSFDFGEK